MKKIAYLKLFNNENLKIDSALGMHAVVAFMQHIGIADALENSIPAQRIREGLYPVALLIAAVCALIDGADRIEQFPCFLEKNKVLMKSLGLRKVPHATTFYKVLQRINTDRWFAVKMRSEMQKVAMKWYIQDHSDITADIDATYMETNKQSGTINYQGEKSISALLMHIGEEQIVWDFVVRDGYENPRTGIPAMVDHFVANTTINDCIKTIRSDSAGYSSEVMHICSNNNSGFIIKIAEHADMEELFRNVKQWNTIDEEKQRVATAETVHTMNTTEPFRCIGVATQTHGELFSRKGYIATNLREKTPYELYKLYAKRGIEEQAIGVLKDELAFGYVPSKHASINEAFALLNILAYNCMTIMKYIMTTKGNDYIKGLVKNNPRIKTLKFLMLDIAARITRSGRQGKA